MNVRIATKKPVQRSVSFSSQSSCNEDTRETETETDSERDIASLESLSASFRETTPIRLRLTLPPKIHLRTNQEQSSTSPASLSSSYSRCDPRERGEENDINTRSLEIQPKQRHAEAQQTLESQNDAAKLHEPLSSTTSSSSIPSRSSSVLSSSEQAKKRNRRGDVRFGQAFLHEHAIIAGDNPGCSCGIPITIDWECLGTTVVDAVALDEQRQRQQPSSRKKIDRLRLSAGDRQELLLDLGYTERELFRLAQQADKAQAQFRRNMESAASNGKTSHSKPLRRVFKGTQERVRKFLLSSTSSPQVRPERLRQQLPEQPFGNRKNKFGSFVDSDDDTKHNHSDLPPGPVQSSRRPPHRRDHNRRAH